MKKQAAIGFIFITLLIDVIGWGLIIPVMPQLIAGMKHIPVNEASKEGGLVIICLCLHAVYLCTHSGKPERSVWAKAGDYCFLCSASALIIFSWVSRPAFGWLFLGRTISGITGASFTTAYAYIADISTAETRSKNFGHDRGSIRTRIHYWPGHRRIANRLGYTRTFLCSCHTYPSELAVWIFCTTGIPFDRSTAENLNGSGRIRLDPFRT